MAPLPIFHGELKASLAAMMAFPNDLEKAELCACWQIASLFNSEMIEQNRSASITRIVRRSAQFANYQNEWTKNRNEGAIVGAVTLVMMSLIEDAPDLATWERAMLYTIDQVRNRSRRCSALAQSVARVSRRAAVDRRRAPIGILRHVRRSVHRTQLIDEVLGVIGFVGAERNRPRPIRAQLDHVQRRDP